MSAERGCRWVISCPRELIRAVTVAARKGGWRISERHNAKASMTDDRGSPDPDYVTFLIQARTEPFENLPPYADDFFNAIGRAVLMWGKLEQSLDNLLLTAINAAARYGPRREMQIALGRKLELLKDIFKTCEPLSG